MDIAELFETKDDILTILKNEHKEVASLFQELKATADEDVQRAQSLYAEIKENLFSHLHAEEAVLYKRMQNVTDLQTDSFEGAQEHALMDVLFSKLDNYSPENHHLWKASIKVLNELVDHHVHEEENSVFPKIRAHFSLATRQKMGDEFLRMQTQILEGIETFPSVLREVQNTGASTAQLHT